MAVTENSYTGNGSTTNYAFTFPYLKTTDIQVQVDATVTTAWSLANATTVQFNTAPASGAAIKILRDTSIENLTATFYAGSAIKSEDLNDNFNQSLYVTQETGNRSFENTGTSTMIGNLNMGEDTSIVFEGATANDHETKLTVADPTADRTITLPNVTGTVVTTGDTATVTGTMLASNSVSSTHIAASQVGATQLASNAVETAKINDNAVTTDKLADANVTGAKIANDTITQVKMASNSVATGNIAANAVTNGKIANNAVDTNHIIDGNVTEAKLANNAVTNNKIADGVVGTDKLANDSVTNVKIADGVVGTDKLASTSVTDAKLAAGSVTTDKLANDAVTSAKIADGTIVAGNLASESVENAKLATNSVSTAKISDAQITNAKIADNTIHGQNKIADGTITAAEIADANITTAKIGANQVTTAKIADDAVTTAKIADAELVTLAGMQAATASKLASGTALTSDLADLNQIDGLTKQTTISDSDASFPTSGAVVDYVAAQLAPVGGLEVIATDAAFPNTQPSAGVVISIADAGGLVVNGSGTSTTGRTAGGSTVTINNIASNFNNTTVDNGVAMMVSSTGSGQIYNYHKATLKEADLLSLSGDINDFAERYRVANTAPSSSLDEGDLWWDSATDKLKVYDGSAWGEVASSGDFYINTISSYSGTGGNSATFNGTAYRFVISNPGSTAQQHFVSINGVIQKPNSGTSQPAEGFAIDGTSIIFSSAPATGADYFITTIGDAVSIGTPSDNTVATAKIQNLAVNTDKIAANAVTLAKLANDAVTGAKIADDAVGVEHIEDLDGTVKWVDSAIAAFGTDGDQAIWHTGSAGYIRNSTGGFCIRNNNFSVKDDGESETLISAVKDGGVNLYYDNNLRFQTNSVGCALRGAVNYVEGLLRPWDATNTDLGTAADRWRDIYVYNDIDMKDHGKLLLGDGDDLKIYHNATNSYLENYTGNLIIDNGSGVDMYINSGNDIYIRPQVFENGIIINGNGAVELYYDAAKKIETKDWGAYVYGDLNVNGGDLLMNNGDDHKIQIGASNDLRIYHDGTNSNNKIEFDQDLKFRPKGSEDGVTIAVDGAVTLYHDDSWKLRTNTTGGEARNNFTIRGDEATSAILHINADEADDGDDMWRMRANTSGELSFDSNNGGSFNTVLKFKDNIYTEITSQRTSQNDYVLKVAKNGSGVADNVQSTMIVFDVASNGRGKAVSGSSGSSDPQWSTYSDRRLKTNFRNYTGGYDKIKAIPVKLYDEVSNDETKSVIGENPATNCVGWIADEFQAVFPEAVFGTKDGVDSDGKPVYQELAAGTIFPHLVQALQTAITKIETLETKVAALEAG